MTEKHKLRIWSLTLVICATGLSYMLHTVMTFHSSPLQLTGSSFMPPAPDNKSEVSASSNMSQMHFELHDWTAVASSPNSTITVMNTGPYHVGDLVQVHITVKDFKGRRKVTGGDQVRIWIKDPVNGACAAGHVEDNQDGSYRGKLKLLWAGNLTIAARIAAPREMISFLHETVQTGRTLLFFKGLFKGKSMSEIKMCSPIPEKYSRFCNLTTRNSGLPWYCEMPVNTSCDAWTSTAYYFPRPKYTTQEIELFKRIHQYQCMDRNIHLTVLNHQKTSTLHASTSYKGLTACNKLPTHLTWDSPTPGGYLYRGAWYSTQCRSTIVSTEESFKTCLKGRKLWLLGDSNLRHVLMYLAGFLKLKGKTGILNFTRAWHKPLAVFDTNRTINIFWGPHALPFVHSTVFDDQLVAKGSHLYIDVVPGKSKDIVVIHFYMHFVGTPPYVFRNHVRKVKDSVVALKRRAPDVKVVVKGSHAFHDPKHLGMFYDFWGTVYDRILREEFASILDDVVFLEVWEQTMSAENWSIHPNATLLKATVDFMMSFVC